MSSKRYITVFIITGIIFGFAFWLSNLFTNSKVGELRTIENQISLNILSTETRYSLLENTSCSHIIIGEGSDIGLNSELTDLAHRVKFLESQLSSDNEDVIYVKKYYTLLQIKDYLLSRSFHDRCNKDIASILYFHQANCSECVKQSIVLDDIASTYPQLRVYWLDKDLQTPALQTLLSMFKINQGPSLVIRDKVYTGFQSLAALEKEIPEVAAWKQQAEKAKNNLKLTPTKTKVKPTGGTTNQGPTTPEVSL